MFQPAPPIRPFRLADYDAARALWQRTEGIGLSRADEREAIAAFLVRNPDLSLIAMADDGLVGTILCGHDGRRGLIHHLAVSCRHRRCGLGRALLRAGLAGLSAAGIDKCHLLVFRQNHDGLAFWRRVGAEERSTLTLLSITTDTV